MTRRMPLILACLAASISLDAAFCAAPSATQPADPSTLLESASGTVVQREQAARALLQENTDHARAAIQHALEDAADPVGQLAAARAVAALASPDRGYMVPLRLMMGTDRLLTEAAAQALARFQDNPDAVRLLVNFASSRQQREADRLIVIRCIGTLADKSAADFLVSLLLREDDTTRVRNAAADALADMTGETTNGRNAKSWQAWWAANSRKPEGQWKQEIIARQAARFVQMRSQYEQLAAELQNTLTQVYEATPLAQQPALLMMYLKSNHAEIRRFGAIMAYNDAMAAKSVSPEAREQLRLMVGDSSREVRLAVANALLATGDPGALDALLGQLQREPDPEVRAAFAAPIASIGDIRAVPALRMLLKDTSANAATAAASALRELGPVIRDKDPALAREVAADLRAALDRAGEAPGSLALREAIAESLVPLRDPAMIPTLYHLLRDADSARIRWAALRALGELKDPKAADTIARYLEDRESGVRLEAVRALGKTSPAEHAEELYRRMNAVEETDASVRDEAWNVLQTTFTRLPLEQLPDWAKRFSGDAAKREVVLRAMVARLSGGENPAQLAAARQSLGATLLERNQPENAAAQFKLAYDYFVAQGDQEMVVEQLVNQYLSSLLRARAYADAQTFASGLLAQRTVHQQTVGVLFRNEARRLNEDRRWADLASLADAARKITPSLAALYMDEIVMLDQAAKRNVPATQPVL